MKLCAFTLVLILSSSAALACPGAGYLQLKNKRDLVAVLNLYGGKVEVSNKYDLVNVEEIHWGPFNGICRQGWTGRNGAWQPARSCATKFFVIPDDFYQVGVGPEAVVPEFKFTFVKEVDGKLVTFSTPANFDPSQPRVKTTGCARIIIPE